MRRIRVIPVLLLRGNGLVKTIRFRNAAYLGDPINTIRIFNDKEVDEVVVLDIDATRDGREVNMSRIAELAGECFMPLAYGGGVNRIEQVRAILQAGAEKVIINTGLEINPEFVREAAGTFGSQSIVASIDVRRNLFGRAEVFVSCGSTRTRRNPLDAARRAEDAGVGEVIVNSIDRDGMMNGYDLDLVRSVAQAVKVPVVALGGAGSVSDLLDAAEAGASAVAAGSLFVFQGPYRAVLINFPDQRSLRDQLFQPLAALDSDRARRSNG